MTTESSLPNASHATCLNPMMISDRSSTRSSTMSSVETSPPSSTRGYGAVFDDGSSDVESRKLLPFHRSKGDDKESKLTCTSGLVERTYELDHGNIKSRPHVPSEESLSSSPEQQGSYDKNGHEKERARLRKIAIDLSLYVNIAILLAKLVAYCRTLSLSVLAALVDSILDVVSQMVLSFTEHMSNRQHGRSSATYPAGAARLEPIGVLTCAALMGMASFEVMKESIEALIFDQNVIEGEHLSSVWSMVAIVLVKVILLIICKRAGESGRRRTGLGSSKAVVVVSDPTLDALAQDHLNDALSNAVAAVALLTALWHPILWFFDPLGAILISMYIIYSWFSTGKEQIEQLTGKAAPDDFIDELHHIASQHDSRLDVDVCRAYHFGPKFLVELEVVLPRDTLLIESHDIGMDLQYEIEAREEVERCFVHIDYEKREYDEHVVSKNPDLMEKLRPSAWYRRAVSF